jgi:hypothetical protein
MQVVQEIVAYFDKKGEMSSRELKRILDKGQVASDVPGNMSTLSDVVGTVYYFRATGMLEGQVWGSGPYTRDSIVGAAAVHAGLLKPGESAVLRLTIASARDQYPGSTKNGVTTSDYAIFPYCWEITAL